VIDWTYDFEPLPFALECFLIDAFNFKLEAHTRRTNGRRDSHISGKTARERAA